MMLPVSHGIGTISQPTGTDTSSFSSIPEECCRAAEKMAKAIHEQVHIAVKESDLVLFLIDAKSGITDLDMLIAKQLRKAASEKTILVVNKADSGRSNMRLTPTVLWHRQHLPVSALHGLGVADLLDVVIERISGSLVPLSNPWSLCWKLAIVGRPNAGKSSLVNKLLGKQNDSAS